MSKPQCNGRGPVRGWLEPKKQQLSGSNSGKPTAQVQPTSRSTKAPKVVTKGCQPPLETNIPMNPFLGMPTKSKQLSRNHLSQHEQSRQIEKPKTSKPTTSSASIAVQVVNVQVINVDSKQLSNLKINCQNTNNVKMSSGNNAKHHKKNVPNSMQGNQSVPRTATKTNNNNNDNKEKSKGRRECINVMLKQTSNCKVIKK